MPILGIDLDTHKVSAVTLTSDGQTIIWHGVAEGKSGKLAADRFASLALEIFELIEISLPDYVYVEGLPFVKSRGSIVDLACILGTVRAVCALHGVPCLVIPGPTWKKTLGMGRTKLEIAEAVQTRYGVSLPTQDLVDAYCVAKAGILITDASITGS